MSTKKEELKYAILCNPEDTRLRLIYADYLDEIGECNRAEFIRVQCELADQLDENSEPRPQASPENDKYQDELEARALELYEQSKLAKGISHGWIGQTLHLLGGNARFKIGRGFVEEVTLTESRWAWYGEQLVLENPIRYVNLIDKMPMPILRGVEINASAAYEGQGSSGEEFSWRWAAHRLGSVYRTAPCRVQLRLFKLLGNQLYRHGNIKCISKDYSTLQSAKDELSNACLRYARKKAGLKRIKNLGSINSKG